MNTRPDLSKRIELVSNRITYLVESIQGVQQEIERYTQELDALKKLADLYNQAGDDPIDVERNAFFVMESRRIGSKGRKGKMVHVTLSLRLWSWTAL